VFHGYLADKQGDFVKAIDFPGAAQTEAFGINEKGDIVGSYADDSGTFHGFLLQDGSFATIDFPGAVLTFPDDINNQGEIAGAYQDALFAFHGFVLDKDGFRTVDDPAQGSLPSTQLFSINNKGDILGDFAADEFGIFHGAFLLTHGTFIPFTVPGATQGIFALGLNDNNDVAGSFLGDDFVQHGFIADQGTVISFDFPGSLATAPFQINSSRHTIGIYADRAVNTHSFLVTFDGPSAGMDATAAPASATPQETDTNGQKVVCGAQQTIRSGGNLSRGQNLICTSR
jgi:probable HAF family extracellular repeat protein